MKFIALSLIFTLFVISSVLASYPDESRMLVDVYNLYGSVDKIPDHVLESLEPAKYASAVSDLKADHRSLETGISYLWGGLRQKEMKDRNRGLWLRRTLFTADFGPGHPGRYREYIGVGNSSLALHLLRGTFLNGFLGLAKNWKYLDDYPGELTEKIYDIAVLNQCQEEAFAVLFTIRDQMRHWRDKLNSSVMPEFISWATGLAKRLEPLAANAELRAEIAEFVEELRTYPVLGGPLPQAAVPCGPTLD